MQKLYNEGRVQGLSSYELYLRQYIASGGDASTAPTEKEWLNYMYQSGRSLILKLNPTSDNVTHLDIPLPDDTNLVANTQIYAYLFFGDCEELPQDDPSSQYSWTKYITDSGYTLANRTDKHPDISPGSSRITELTHPLNFEGVPEITDDIKAMVTSFANIVDGGVLMPNTWSDPDPSVTTPAKDLKPNLSMKPYIRLILDGQITHTIYILFTNFADKTVTQAVSGLDGSTSTPNPQNGDFLGSAVFPWISKIYFISTSLYMKYITDVIADIEGDTGALEGRVSSLETRMTNNENALDALTTDVNAYRAELLEKINTNAANIASLTTSKQDKLTPANNTIVIGTDNTIRGNYTSSDGSLHVNGNDLRINLGHLSLSDFGVTASAAELNKLDGAIVSTSEINVLHGITASTTELNYTDGVTSNIQTQLDKKGSITKVETAAGAYTHIEVTSGTATIKIPTDTIHLTGNSAGYITSAKLGSRVVLLDKEAIDGTTYFNFGVKYPLAQSITNFDFCAVSFRYDPNNESLNKNNYVGTSYVVKENYPDRVDAGTSDDYGTYQYVYAGNVADSTAIRYIRFAFPTAGEFWCKGNANVTLGNNKSFHVYVIGYKFRN